VYDDGFGAALILQPWTLGHRRIVFGVEGALWSAAGDVHAAASGFAGYQIWLTPWLTPSLRAHIVSDSAAEHPGLRAQAEAALYLDKFMYGFASTDVAGFDITPRTSFGFALKL
jgi:hypothetical protein